jgi:DNA repair exonuclease SbcCD ATPase subunit
MADTDNTAEVIAELKSKPQVPIKGNTSDFLKKFSKQQADDGKPSATNVGDPNLGIPKYNEEEPPEEPTGVTEAEITSERTGKKKGFVERQIEENRKLKEELEKYKKEEVPKFETKIQELERLVSESKSTAETNHYQEQLNKANQEKLEVEQQLSEQIKELRNKLDFHDITSNPDFKKNYLDPIKNTYDTARQLLANDPTLLSTFSRAVNANASIFNASSEEDRRAAEADRDQAFEEITNSLSQFKQYQFAEQVNSFIKATQNHHSALVNFEETKQNILQTAKQREQEGRNKYLNQWREGYKTTQQEIDNATAIPDSLSEYMKEKGIKYDLSRDEAIALAATQQSNEQASVEDMNRLINQGRAYQKLQAQLKAYQEMVKEKDEYIAQLKGSSRITSSPSASDSQKPRMSLSEGLAAKIARFSPQNRVTA